MKYISTICLSGALLLGAAGTALAQGDSDPGMSTIGALRSSSAVMMDDETYENERLQLGFANTFAKGERDVVINNPHVEMRVPMSTFGYVDVKLQVYAAAGDLADVAGLGDLVVAYTHFLPAGGYGYYGEGNVTWQFTGGLRIGTGNATQTDGKSRPLPMAYQASQGTTDLILGVNMWYKQFLSVAVGYQQPFIRYNDNNYTGLSTNNDIAYSNADYPPCRKLYRQGDIMMRLEGHYGGKRAGISAGPLAFYHVADDLYDDLSNKVREINNSAGFTVNIAGNAYMRFGRYGSWKLDVSGGIPVTTRDVHPDGSTREWTVTPRLTFFFNQQNVMFN